MASEPLYESKQPPVAPQGHISINKPDFIQL